MLAPHACKLDMFCNGDLQLAVLQMRGIVRVLFTLQVGTMPPCRLRLGLKDLNTLIDWGC